MPPASPSDEPPIRPPHPLALRLIERLRARPQALVLDFAAGRGRHTEALRRAGLTVLSVDDRIAQSHRPLEGVGTLVAGVLSTHGLLHGTPEAIASRVTAIADRLEDGGAFYATFGSINDARFGRGERVAASTFAPLDGDERGIAHTFYDEKQLRILLDRSFIVESLEEHVVDEIAGSWAHRERPLERATHWFVVARKRS